MEHKVHHPAPHSAESPSRQELQGAFYGAGLAAIIVAAIYFGQPIFMPAALAVLLAFALAPVAERLRRLHLGQIPSVLLTVLFAFLIIGALGAYIGSEFAHAGGRSAAISKQSVRTRSSRSAARRTATGSSRAASAMLDQLDNESHRRSRDREHDQAGRPQADRSSRSSRRMAGRCTSSRRSRGRCSAPLATTGIVIIFVIFILLQKEDLRDRFIRLAGSSDLRRTTVALDDGASRLWPLSPDADCDQRLLRHPGRRGALADRDSQCRTVGPHRR